MSSFEWKTKLLKAISGAYVGGDLISERIWTIAKVETPHQLHQSMLYYWAAFCHCFVIGLCKGGFISEYISFWSHHHRNMQNHYLSTFHGWFQVEGQWFRPFFRGWDQTEKYLPKFSHLCGQEPLGTIEGVTFVVCIWKITEFFSICKIQMTFFGSFIPLQASKITSFDCVHSFKTKREKIYFEWVFYLSCFFKRCFWLMTLHCYNLKFHCASLFRLSYAI